MAPQKYTAVQDLTFTATIRGLLEITEQVQWYGGTYSLISQRVFRLKRNPNYYTRTPKH